MTNALSMRARLLVVVVALGLALAGSTVVGQDAEAARNPCPYGPEDPIYCIR